MMQGIPFESIEIDPRINSARVVGRRNDVVAECAYSATFDVSFTMGDGTVYAGTSLEADEVAEWLRLLEGEATR